MEDSIIKECDICKQTILQIEEADGRVFAWDFPNGEEHECFDIPDDAEVMVLSK